MLTRTVARIKKIIAQDEDIAQCSNGAAFAISVATEEFLRYITEQAFIVAKSEAKPRKNIQYKDIATAVAKLDNLQFLSDTVPRTMTYKQVKEKEKKVKENAEADTNGTNAKANDDGDNKQRSITTMMGQSAVHANSLSDDLQEPMSPGQQRISLSMANSPIVDRTVQHQTNGHGHTAENFDDSHEDVEMQD